MITDGTTISSAYAARADLADRDVLPAKIGRYRPVRRLGRGGMGVVYEAVDPSLDRRVAVKVLHPARSGDGEEVRGRRRRLLREAQAMARLSHPNVLPVFDVGESGADVFLAMELVDGESLADWLKSDEHGWRAIVALFTEAGRGLAAAHAAGVVHRDFKPGNVLVGEEGRARVVDFGLARAAADAGLREPAEWARASTDERPEGEPRVMREPITRTGAVLGTPAYMSPEQRDGAVADARSDQYSFCVSLWEALGGQLPRRPRTWSAAVRTGGPRGPRALRRVLVRGLRTDPRERHPSMDDLLRELERLLHRRRRWLAAAAGGLVAVATLAGLALAGTDDDDAPMCRTAERKLVGVWDGAAVRALRERFAASSHPAAAASATRVIGRLDDYARAWVSARTEACEATRAGEQSVQLLDARMLCLDRRLDQLGALVAVLRERADPDGVAGSVDAVWRLEPLAGCADPDLLTGRHALPGPEREREVSDLRARLDRAAALLKAGRYAAGRDVAAGVVESARELAYPPVQAEALLLHGELLDAAGDPAAAEASLRAAALSAAEAEDDERLAAAWVALVFTIGKTQARHQEALQLAELAEAAVTRARSSRERGALENHIGTVLQAIGRHPDAERHLARAVALRERVLGAGHPDTAASLAALGSTLASEGKLDEARRSQERALAVRRAALGEQHPSVARSLTSLARLASLGGDEAEAARIEEQALAIRMRSLGPQHADVGVSLSNLGAYAKEQGDLEGAAIHFERALAVFTAALPADHPHVARMLSGLGETYVRIGRARDAVPLLERALAIEEKLEDAIELAHARFALATAVDPALGDRRRARQLMSSARDTYAGDETNPQSAEWHQMAVDWLRAHPAR